MKLLEYQAKELLAAHGVPVTTGEVFSRGDDLSSVSRVPLPCVVKAQVPVGGRGKAGGVAIARTHEEARAHAERILAMEIKGIPVRAVLVAEAVDIASEYYLAFALDRSKGALLAIASIEGGVDIEETVKTRPDAIVRKYLGDHGLTVYEARELAFSLFDDPASAKRAVPVIRRLFKAFAREDATLVEINPLVLTAGGDVVAVDAKVILDDNASFRHEWTKERLYDDPREAEARAGGLSFVSLDGDIGCCVNGAGLAMATMDVISHFGGKPANFLDVGGSSSPEKVKLALSLISRSSGVRVVYFNIYGGITRCDDIATGLIEAAGALTVPLVVRLVGTNEKRAREMLAASSLNLVSAVTLSEGAREAVRLAAAR